MLPFIRIFGRTLPMYGLLGVLGFLLGLLFILLRAPRFSLKRDDAVYIYVFAVLGALLGAKLVYILTVLPELLALIRSGAGVEELFGYLSGGLVFFGGDGQENGCGGDRGVQQPFRGAVQSGFGRLIAAAPCGRPALRTGGCYPAGHQSGAGGADAESRFAGASSHCP